MKIWNAINFWSNRKPVAQKQETTDSIALEQIKSCPVLIYIEGTPETTECQYCAAAVSAIQKTGFSFAYKDINETPSLREEVPKISHYQRFPQLFIGGQFIGGCNTILEMLDRGTLDLRLEEVQSESA